MGILRNQGIDLTYLNKQISQIIGDNKINGGVVKQGKFLMVSIPKGTLPKLHNPIELSGNDIRSKYAKRVCHRRYNEKTNKFVIKSKHAASLIACIKDCVN